MAKATTKRASTSGPGFADEEKAAMKERSSELKSERSGTKKKKDPEAEVLEKIAEMSEKDREIAARIHELVGDSAPQLVPRLWYGMPAYALDGKVLCFFQTSAKFKTRYATLGFNDVASLDDGDMWATAFAIDALTPEVEKQVANLLSRAVRG